MTELTFEPVDEKFAITDDGKAQLALEKIREARADTDRWTAYYSEQLRKISEANEQTEAFFSGLLERYFLTVPHKVTKTRQSYRLPGGKLALKAQQPTYERDEEALLAWAKVSFPEAVNVKESVSWGDLKQHLTFTPDGDAVVIKTGEMVPGVKAVKRPDAFVVEIGKEENTDA